MSSSVKTSTKVLLPTSSKKQPDTWEGESVSPSAKGPGYGQPVPDHAEFLRRFSVSPPSKEKPSGE